MRIGVLSLQGGVVEHMNHIRELGCEAVEVKKIEDIKDINGLIFPGGESTTIGKILRERDMLIPLRERIISGLPVWGTCAGMILLAKEIENDEHTHLSVMDIKVRRKPMVDKLIVLKLQKKLKEFLKIQYHLFL